ncbi:MAG TPA: shikimate kinase [Streptosporangiaceae bacterium]
MIVLVGFMGAGKSTVGRLLARKLDLRFADSDTEIEQRAGRRVREIFAADGEAAFRAQEQAVIADLIGGPDLVLALGGGAVQSEQTRRLLRPASVVYLQISYAEMLRRVGGDPRRPMLRRPDVEDIYRRRLAGYESVATLTIATDGRRPGAVCLDVMNGLAGLRRVDRAGYSH